LYFAAAKSASEARRNSGFFAISSRMVAASDRTHAATSVGVGWNAEGIAPWRTNSSASST
jgi:hypothetical protein